MGIANELGLEEREMFEQKGGQVTIFSEVQQILHVQGVDAVFRVISDHLVGDDERLVSVGRPHSVKRETTRQTSDGAEQAFKGLRHVMGQEVLVNLETDERGLFAHE